VKSSDDVERPIQWSIFRAVTNSQPGSSRALPCPTQHDRRLQNIDVVSMANSGNKSHHHQLITSPGPRCHHAPCPQRHSLTTNHSPLTTHRCFLIFETHPPLFQHLATHPPLLCHHTEAELGRYSRCNLKLVPSSALPAHLRSDQDFQASSWLSPTRDSASMYPYSSIHSDFVQIFACYDVVVGTTCLVAHCPFFSLRFL
jgi:hypothetical protein